jgi:hypothetical protein
MSQAVVTALCRRARGRNTVRAARHTEAARTYQMAMASRILPDHTIIQRPDCALQCNGQTAFALW